MVVVFNSIVLDFDVISIPYHWAWIEYKTSRRRTILGFRAGRPKSCVSNQTKVRDRGRQQDQRGDGD
jgi:hypothetical protein